MNKMLLTNFHFYNPKNYIYNKPVKGLRGYEVGYSFAFNGKEGDSETLTQDYGMRIYDFRLGRFLSVDPLTKDYPFNSTYAFAENDVIRSIDLDGLEKVIYTFAYANKKWTVTKLELAKAGPLGDGVLLKFGTLFFYGNELPKGATGKEFTKVYESKQLKGYKVKGETNVTIGYGHLVLDKKEKEIYKEGTTITDDQANSLFSIDYNKRDVNIKGLDAFQIDAVSDYSYNTCDDGSKTEKKYLNADNKDGNFFLNRSATGYKGLKARRAAEYILFEDKKYLKLDYSEQAQKSWSKLYDKLVKKETKTEEKK